MKYRSFSANLNSFVYSEHKTLKIFIYMDVTIWMLWSCYFKSHDYRWTTSRAQHIGECNVTIVQEIVTAVHILLEGRTWKTIRGCIMLGTSVGIPSRKIYPNWQSTNYLTLNMAVWQWLRSKVANPKIAEHICKHSANGAHNMLALSPQYMSYFMQFKHQNGTCKLLLNKNSSIICKSNL